MMCCGGYVEWSVHEGGKWRQRKTSIQLYAGRKMETTKDEHSLEHTFVCWEFVENGEPYADSRLYKLRNYAQIAIMPSKQVRPL